ncbi:hypothetical protein GUJ93_ZPchr0002g26562 [Zizania palustris]|uniref:Uncharacterized protein n=1 Tax=Zizania palustris TaxID=103762 RepID=A0A8J5S406_ZIZPA|nr:hypothetical protein GUJ93_ZPchr0002g26562 [Zizania palustris]
MAFCRRADDRPAATNYYTVPETGVTTPHRAAFAFCVFASSPAKAGVLVVSGKVVVDDFLCSSLAPSAPVTLHRRGQR